MRFLIIFVMAFVANMVAIRTDFPGEEEAITKVYTDHWMTDTVVPTKTQYLTDLPTFTEEDIPTLTAEQPTSGAGKSGLDIAGVIFGGASFIMAIAGGM
jgi:hypothetical protein